jgi:3-phosphoinositide dependent protein kinase-1
MESTSDYWVGSTIGEGSYGNVVYAKHKMTNKNVAIKVVLKRQMRTDANFISDIRKEKDLLVALKSDCVVPLWAAFHDSECMYFVLECLTGGDLDHVIRCGLEQDDEDAQGRNAWQLTIPYYTLQLLSALEYIHSQNVVHADLKPHNVLVSGDGKLKLADFGSAIQVRDTMLRTDRLPTSLTPETSGALRGMGTADYASPELIRGEALPVSSHDNIHSTAAVFGIDLWSFGCVLFAMWEGCSPFHDASDALAIRRIVEHRQDQPLPWKKMPSQWHDLIGDLLAPEANHRLGIADLEEMSDSDKVMYTSIRRRSCLLTNDDDGCEKVPFLAPEPSWWTNAKSDALRDGAAGWISFLLA